MAPLSTQTTSLIETVLAAYDIAPAALRDIRTGRVNKHWHVVTAGGAYVLRRYTESRTVSAIEYEHDVLRHLLKCAWPVAVPIVARDRETSVEVEGRRFSLFPLLPGRPTSRPGPRQALLRGRLLARLHGDLASWQPPGQRDGFGRL